MVGPGSRVPASELHLGVEQEFRPARKAHVGFVVDDVVDLVDLCRAQNLETTDINEIDGYRRAHVLRPPRQPPRVHGAGVIY